jgi:mRNA-degrading endonuclease HigB of HigAB toxin-antitoxin module
VNVISRHAILDAGMRHPDAESALTVWYKAARQARWESLHEVRAGDSPARAPKIATSGSPLGQMIASFDDAIGQRPR